MYGRGGLSDEYRALAAQSARVAQGRKQILMLKLSLLNEDLPGASVLALSIANACC